MDKRAKVDSTRQRRKSKSKRRRKLVKESSSTNETPTNTLPDENSGPELNQVDNGGGVVDEEPNVTGYFEIDEDDHPIQVQQGENYILRWNHELDNADDEAKWIEIYKCKRRERYAEAARAEAEANPPRQTRTVPNCIARINMQNSSRLRNLKIPNIYPSLSNSTTGLYKATSSTSRLSTLSY